MNSEQWERTKQILQEALQLSSDHRPAYLNLACGTDRELRAEVESLIASHEQAGSQFLAAAAPEILNLDSSPISPAALRDKVIGSYRLVEEIGRGGMGQVWLAEQTAPVRRQVALKLIKAGMYDDEVVKRFQLERQSLAIMDHPSIAKVFEAGATPEGQPYFVMEYVPGVPITDYCDRKRLKIRERLELFIKVCEAVQHAHQKAVLHRDLKPANILVQEVDGKAVPRIIDFGLAKAISAPVAGESLYTQLGNFVGTPGYMSPEQADPGRVDVDTRTDVYSLGAVLYVLLTGCLPFRGKPGAKAEKEQPLDEILRQVREEDPPRPSTKVSTDRETGAAAAEARGTDAKQLVSLLRGDLDWITMKALEKDRSRRYGTSTELAADIARYLRNEPVQAHPPGVWYRSRKFVRRYWLPVTAATMIIASLSAGLFAANRQRLIAERRFAQLRQLAHQVLFDLDSELSKLPGAINARSKLVATSTQFLAGLSADAFHDKALALEVAGSYLQVARMQGVPAWNNLGQYGEADQSLRKAETILQAVLATDPRNREAIWLSANAAHDRATIDFEAGGAEQKMIASASLVEQRFDQLARLGNLTRTEINAATYIYGDLAELEGDLHRFKDAVHYARLGLEISRTISTVPGPRAQVFSELAGALMELGDVQGALGAIHQARTEWEHLRQQGETKYVRLMLGLIREQEGRILGEDGALNVGRPLEAAARFREGFDPMEQWASEEAKEYQLRCNLAEIGRYLGDVLRHSDPKKALDVYDRSLLRIREVPNNLAARRLEALLLAGSSYPARWMHREADARQRIDSAFQVLRQTKDYPSEAIKPGSNADTAVRALADHYGESGQPAKALELYEDLLRKIMASNPDPQSDLLNAAYISRLDVSLAALLRRVGRTDEASTLEGNRLELWRSWGRKLPNNPFVQRQLGEKPRSSTAPKTN